MQEVFNFVSNKNSLYIGMRANHSYTEPLLFKESLMGSDCCVTGQVGLVSDIRSYEGIFMNYKKNYDDYISYVKTLDRKKLDRSDPDYVYYEWHHVTPKCMGGTDAVNNIVLLTAREHVLAHYLLTKIYPSNSKILFAFNMVTGETSKRTRGVNLIHSKLIASAMEDYRVSCSGVNHPMYGRKPSEESNKKNSEKNKVIQKGRIPWNLGIPMTEEAKLKSSNTMKGYVWSEERNKKLSKSLMGHAPTYIKPVRCIETGEIFPSVYKASEWAGVNLIPCLKGRNETARGFHWEYYIPKVV